MATWTTQTASSVASVYAPARSMSLAGRSDALRRARLGQTLLAPIGETLPHGRSILRVGGGGMSNIEEVRLVEVLRSTQLFDSLGEPEIIALIPYVTQASFEEGDLLLEEDAAGRNLLVLVEGTAGVYKHGTADADHRLAEVRPGDVLGEMSFVDPGQTRSATIRAETQLLALMLDWDAFERFGETHSSAAQRVLVNIARRVSDRVRSLNSETVTRLEHELHAQRERAMMARLVTYVILLLFGYNLTLQATMRLSTEAPTRISSPRAACAL